jgi:hypothetical protein
LPYWAALRTEEGRARLRRGWALLKRSETSQFECDQDISWETQAALKMAAESSAEFGKKAPPLVERKTGRVVLFAF